LLSGANVTRKDICTCPVERIYSQSEICDYCREVVFYDDTDYAELMGFALVGETWLPRKNGAADNG